MAETKIRSSKQLLIDADLPLNTTESASNKKITGLANGVNANDAVNKSQLDAATAGVQSGLHVPVADLAAGKAVVAAERTDKMMMLVETLGLYRYDAESAATTDDVNVFKPTDVTGNGRWIRMSVEMSNHENLSGLLGGATNDHQHLTTAQLSKLNGIEAGADVTDAANVGSSIAGTSEKTAMVDADSFGIIDSAASNALKRITLGSLKTLLRTAWDSIYQLKSEKDASGGYVGLTLFKINFKNTLNTFTSFFVNANTAARTYTFPDRDGTMADGTDITNAKARANHTGTQTASTISDFAAAALAAAPAETVNTIGTLIGVTATAKATPVDADELGFSDSAASNVLKSMTFANLKSFLVTYFNTLYNNYVHPNHSGDVTSVADGATTIASNAVTNAKLADMATQTFKGRNTAATGDPEDLSITTVKTMLGLNTANQSTRVYRSVLTQESSTSHTVNVTNFISGTEEVFRNGILLDNLGNDYSLNYVDNVIEIILVTGLSAGEKLKINYSYSV